METGENVDERDYPHPDKGSDCTFPEEINLQDKIGLLRWKFLEAIGNRDSDRMSGGHRLPTHIPKIPHVDETEVISAVVSDEAQFLELAMRLSEDAKQVQQEYVYAKQRFDLLSQERDLLKWHVASNSKVLHLKQGELENAEYRAKTLERRLQHVSMDADRLEREKTYLSTSLDHIHQQTETLQQEYAAAQEEMTQWLGRRGDYLADTTTERRKAGYERALRLRQWRKLNRACNVDKKWHTKIEGVRNADNMIFDAYDDASRLLAVELERAGDIMGPLRAAVAEAPPIDPLADFVGTTSAEVAG